jgi:hypothetical protein
VFARYYVELPLDPEHVVQALTREPGAWIPGLAADAHHEGDRLLAEVGFGTDVRVARKVAVEVGRPISVTAKTIVPIRWDPMGGAGLFPALDADLEIAPLGNGRTQLAMSARYVPPLGTLGRAVDRAILHRVAEATLKDFLDNVLTALMASDGTGGPADGQHASSVG